MVRAELEKAFLYKRMNKKFHISRKKLNEIAEMIRDVWIKEGMDRENCTLFISKRGFSHHSDGLYQDDGKSKITICCSQQWLNYQEIKEKGWIHGDFISYMKIVLLHEIGHFKDEKLRELKKERATFRRKMIMETSQTEWERLANEVWKRTKMMEENAWDYVEPRIADKEQYDYQVEKFHAIQKHKDHWEKVSRLMFSSNLNNDR